MQQSVISIFQVMLLRRQRLMLLVTDYCSMSFTQSVYYYKPVVQH